jgi:hypothetical protein
MGLSAAQHFGLAVLYAKFHTFRRPNRLLLLPRYAPYLTLTSCASLHQCEHPCFQILALCERPPRQQDSDYVALPVAT